jgi:hypothetical protein
MSGMIKSLAVAPTQTRYELRFTDLFKRGHGYAFPCDAQGHVDIDELSDRGRTNYLFARAVVGTELSAPIVSPVGRGSVSQFVVTFAPIGR